MSNEESGNDEIVAKYKKLLSLARSSLESNQATIAAKDKQIQQLVAALEEEKANRSRKITQSAGKEDEKTNIPRNLLRRVDVGQSIWILIEYEGQDDCWMEFTSEQSLSDFISRVPGVPLIKPSRCLTPTESRQIEDDAKKRVDLITEEFRRYKVRAEIARKQKDAESKQILIHGGTSLPPSPPVDSVSADAASAEELRRYKLQLQEQETKWRTAFERAMKENEQLRTRSSDAVLITQLREQYETCLKDKNALQEKLKIYEKVLHESPSGAGNRSLEQSYIELRDEYKEFRRRVQAIETQRQIEDDLKGSLLLQRGDSSRVTATPPREILSSNTTRPVQENSNSLHESPGPASGSANYGLIESKVKYIKQMVFQYLSCKDPEVKLHIESALIAMFRYSDQERIAIEERKKEESEDTLSSIASFLGTFAVT